MKKDVAPKRVFEPEAESAAQKGAKEAVALQKLLEHEADSVAIPEKIVSATPAKDHPVGTIGASELDVIHIEIEAEDSEGDISLAQKVLESTAAKRKGKEKIREPSKKAHFSSDPLSYALNRASEAELLFNRSGFVLLKTPVFQACLSGDLLLGSLPKVVCSGPQRGTL
jgi:hypothetical protein